MKREEKQQPRENTVSTMTPTDELCTELHTRCKSPYICCYQIQQTSF